MEGEPNHRAPSHRPLTSNTTSSSPSPSSLFPQSVRELHAAFKRHHPPGTMQSNNIKPRRTLIPQRGKPISSDPNLRPTEEFKSTQSEFSSCESVSVVADVNENQIDTSITLPSVCGTITNTYEENKTFESQRNNEPVASSFVESHNVQSVDLQKKVQFSSDTAVHEMDTDISNQAEAEAAISLGPEGESQSLLSKRTMKLHDQLHHQFRNFLNGDLNRPITQSSVIGSSCATTTLINSASAPVLNSTTYGSHVPELNRSNGNNNLNSQPIIQGNIVKPICPTSCSGEPAGEKNAALLSGPDLTEEPKGTISDKSDFSKNPSIVENKSNLGNGPLSGATDLKIQHSLAENPSSSTNSEPLKPEKQGKPGTSKAAPRKRGYDPDKFFKVNGKLYQRLGKIGSGGSSEVYKVISSDCLIYALKKIKLKGRDYATAYGFCQEIGYLNKLKGKNNIIQLIDYEVTDKTLLQEVLNGSMSNKDGRVKEEGFIFMILEYGEIDLAHMLLQKWKEMDITNSTIDDNWLRFFWQQILQSVNTIHEERIVHSDLKPANFLLVKGSLKLIDFGIAKAIMSDTTNIQRDSQMGTLSYMSPEAFMCNETDANGNTIKCGRSSDIWSLGCILYQMVYGQTPFSEYKTFWAKLKVITDPNHKIKYKPISNPWLLDLMKKCLVWDRNERWRIPQLLNHPFLVPPVAPQLSSVKEQSYKLLQLVAESCSDNPKALLLCRQLRELLMNPRS